MEMGELDRVIAASPALGSDAIVHMVRALAAISQDELRDAKAPRVFSLVKIVQTANLNMMRVRCGNLSFLLFTLLSRHSVIQ